MQPADGRAMQPMLQANDNAIRGVFGLICDVIGFDRALAQLWKLCKTERSAIR
jgi:hypothetical protein